VAAHLGVLYLLTLLYLVLLTFILRLNCVGSDDILLYLSLQKNILEDKIHETVILRINHLNRKRRLFYLRTQFVNTLHLIIFIVAPFIL